MLLLLWCLAVPVPPAAASSPPPGKPAGAGDTSAGGGLCAADGLRKAVVTAGLRLDHDNRTFTKVFSTLTVEVPPSWPHAHELLLSPDSDRYRGAMRCLVRGPLEGFHTRWREWRSSEPTVTVLPEKSGHGRDSAPRLKVVMTAHGWVEQREKLHIGAWSVDVGRARWTIRLEPPGTLERARWKRITVDPGRPGAASAEPAPDGGRGANTLVWNPAAGGPVPDVVVGVVPAWPRSFSAQDDNPPFAVFDEAGGLLLLLALVGALWCVLVVLPGHPVPTPQERRAVANLRDWSWTLLAVALLVQGHHLRLGWIGAFQESDEWRQQAAYAPRAWLTSTAAGIVLLLFARPPRTLRVTAALLFGATATAALWLALAGPDTALFIQPSTTATWRTVGAVWTVTIGSFLLFLLGGVAAVRRVVVHGGLIHGTSAGWRTRRLLGGTVLALTVVAVCYAVTAEREWRRGSWLSPHADPFYGAWHQAELRSSLLWFTHNAHAWWATMLWIPSGLALLAVLRARGTLTRQEPVARRGPRGADRLMLLLLFPVMAAMNIGDFTSSSALVWVWSALYFLALVVVLRLFASRAVAAQRLARSGEPLGTVLAARHAPRLRDRARRFRELHAQLRALDQGQPDEGGAQRRVLETRLRRLHRWRSSTGRGDSLPHQVSVVDAALVLGPAPTWWDNGVRAARLTQPVSLPFSVGLVWETMLRGESLTGTLHYGLGLPDVFVQLVLWQVGYGAAGFVLGALWHELPGRRGPAKALAPAAAYALPIGLFALGNWGLGEEQTALAFSAAAMLLVLTLTGIMMDLETFRGERHFWRSRLALLHSVYQMRYLSIQVAWLLAQAAALVTIWQFIDEAASPPPTNGNR
ncbi:DUF6185 family protein [Streptomyces fructofermentans]|uniref:Integral membrane protein n=1 Tax=Streptomyces fructofermentans TaxID=152141 RepID=A0A918KU28_9ACTN|nr:DUF6185 family protein [Streptomyces fructofermentans]GGX76536.1 hypothetical protein GCM10010515_50480 [Streptomyces fructofermentans]